MSFFKSNKKNYEDIALENGTYPAAVKSWKEAKKKSFENPEELYDVVRFVFALPPNDKGQKPVVSVDSTPYISKPGRKASKLKDLLTVFLGAELVEQYREKLEGLTIEAEYDKLFKAMLDSTLGKACSVEVEVSETGYKKVKKVGAPIKGMVVPVTVKQQAVPQDDFAGYTDSLTATEPVIADDDQIPF